MAGAILWAVKFSGELKGEIRDTLPMGKRRTMDCTPAFLAEMSKVAFLHFALLPLCGNLEGVDQATHLAFASVIGFPASRATNKRIPPSADGTRKRNK